ncbi:Uncharacterised protein [Bordetella pertussis]|nr:Uncharacterised protein [Bordetella pertussis]
MEGKPEACHCGKVKRLAVIRRRPRQSAAVVCDRIACMFGAYGAIGGSPRVA